MTFLPKWMKQFQLSHWHFNAHVVTQNVQDAVIALSEGSCDLMFCYHRPYTPILLDSDKFDYQVIGHEAFILIPAEAPSGIPAARQQEHADPVLGLDPINLLGRVVDMILKLAPTELFLERCYEANWSVPAL
ncbi:LysR substrate-binding domain-containing protein [Neisseriaceae bacterium JH1-16]|nr:LysR substrate-binding domain-containing protein [Neisseriaceae bacterium JH1-16]